METVTIARAGTGVVIGVPVSIEAGGMNLHLLAEGPTANGDLEIWHRESGKRYQALKIVATAPERLAASVQASVERLGETAGWDLIELLNMSNEIINPISSEFARHPNDPRSPVDMARRMFDHPAMKHGFFNRFDNPDNQFIRKEWIEAAVRALAISATAEDFARAMYEHRYWGYVQPWAKNDRVCYPWRVVAEDVFVPFVPPMSDSSAAAIEGGVL